MPNSSRGRRLVSEQLSLLPREDDSPRHPGVSRRARRKLPTDRTILGALLKRVAIWCLKLAGSFVLVTVGLVLLYRFIDPPLTPLMLIRPIEAVAAGRVTAIDKEWTDIDDVSPALLRSVIAAEDARFFTHSGVDWKAVEDARKYNERTKTTIRGASTITMQCARNVFLWQGRNYLRKGLEAYFTYLMETFWSKKRILEVYVNVIEWGDRIYGIGAASEHYFGVPASKLTARQAALLASVLPNPRRYNAGSPDGYISRRSARIQAEAPIVSLAPLALGTAAVKKKD